MYWSAKLSHGWNQGRHEQNTQYTLQTLDYALAVWDWLILLKWCHHMIARHHNHHFQATWVIGSLQTSLQIIPIIPSTLLTSFGVMRPCVQQSSWNKNDSPISGLQSLSQQHFFTVKARGDMSKTSHTPSQLLDYALACRDCLVLLI